LEGLQAAQKADKDIAIIIQLSQKSVEKPAWEEVALASSDVKTLWSVDTVAAVGYPGRSVNRRFESANGLTEYW